jgi:predicted Zn-dependent protease
MTPAEGERLGAQIVARLRARHRIVDDAELQGFVRSVGQRLVQHTEHSGQTFHFYVIDTQDINAFALPGGYIGINAGLITATDSASELASVMAHEIGHVTQRHIARQAADSTGETIATLATAIVAAIAGAQMGGGAATAAIMSGMSHLGMQRLSYTRAHESEADRVGIRDLARSGYDPHAMVSFFGKLQRHSDLYGVERVPQILLSHPVTSTRMAEASARAADYPNVSVHTSPEYPYMRARTRVLEARSATDARDYFYHKLHSSQPSPADRYGYALTLGRLSQYEKAIALMRAGQKKHPDVLAWRMGLAQVLDQAGKSHAAGQVLAAALQQFADNKALKLAYAKNLKAQDKPETMRNYLLAQTRLLEHDPEAQRLLAEGAGQQKRLGEAYYRQARYLAMLDYYPRAINQLRTALQTAHLSSYDKARLRALRRQMVTTCHKAWSASECRRGVMKDAQY